MAQLQVGSMWCRRKARLSVDSSNRTWLIGTRADQCVCGNAMRVRGRSNTLCSSLSSALTGTQFDPTAKALSAQASSSLRVDAVFWRVGCVCDEYSVSSLGERSRNGSKSRGGRARSNFSGLPPREHGFIVFSISDRKTIDDTAR